MSAQPDQRYFTPLPKGPLPPGVEPPPIAEHEPIDISDRALQAPRNRWFKPGLIALVGLLLVMGVHEAVEIVQALARVHVLLAAIAGGLFAVAIALAGAALWHGRGVLMDQRALAALRKHAGLLRGSRRNGEFDPFKQAMQDFYQGKPQLPALEAVLADIPASWEDGEALDYLQVQFLGPLDAQAEARVREVALQSGIMVAFSPWVLLDMLIVLWRALSLLDEIGRIHGIRGSVLGRWVLLKQVLASIAVAGGGEWLIDQWVERSSNKLLAGLSGAAAQGMGCALYTARLGYVAIEVSRPVAAPAATRSRLRELYNLLGRQLRDRLAGSRGSD